MDTRANPRLTVRFAGATGVLAAAVLAAGVLFAAPAPTSASPPERHCYADCDRNGTLDFFDFLCFQNAFLARDLYADCDQNGVFDIFDFLCFQAAFAAGCPTRPKLPEEVVRLARLLETLPPPPDDDDDFEPPAGEVDPTAPVNALRVALADLEALAGTMGGSARRPVGAAFAEVRRAWDDYSAGSPDLEHLVRTAEGLSRAQAQLRIAKRLADPPTVVAVQELQTLLVGISRRMATDIVGAAERAGVQGSMLVTAKQRLELGFAAQLHGDYQAAAVHYGGALNFAANTIVFDVDLFQEKIFEELVFKVVGFAYSIAYQGQLYQGGQAGGLSRTLVDPPSLGQSPDKKMHVASVSKPITAIMTLRLMELNGLTPDSKFAPYLPSDWELGDGVADLTFRDLFKHTSGFGQNEVGNKYDELKAGVALPVNATPCPCTNCPRDDCVTGTAPFCYKNANYGLMRILVPGLLGFDIADYPEFDPAALAAACFLDYGEQVYSPIGVLADCTNCEPNPTILYDHPWVDPGYPEPDRRLQCGGYGWFMSSNELASIMANLRMTETLLPGTSRQVMEQNFLGYMDPACYGWTQGAFSDSFGVYYMHGGDWFQNAKTTHACGVNWVHGRGEAHTCVVAFPIQVQVGLVINSKRGFSDYQCILLRKAFDDSWVPK